MSPKKLSGDEIRALREKIFDRQRFSQEAFARLFNVSTGTVRHWESFGSPSNNRGAKLARLKTLVGEPERVIPTLGMGLAQFLDWKPPTLGNVRIIDLLNTDEGLRILISPEQVPQREINAVVASCVMGNFFPDCQLCLHDGNCPLRHCDYMGVAPGEGVDPSAYPGHEDLPWHFSAFQHGAQRSACTGRIHPTGSLFVPLTCQCGTVMNSGGCGKFSPSSRGRQAITAKEEIAQTLGLELDVLSWENIVEAGLESELERFKDSRYFAFSR